MGGRARQADAEPDADADRDDADRRPQPPLLVDGLPAGRLAGRQRRRRARRRRRAVRRFLDGAGVAGDHRAFGLAVPRKLLGVNALLEVVNEVLHFVAVARLIGFAQIGTVREQRFLLQAELTLALADVEEERWIGIVEIRFFELVERALEVAEVVVLQRALERLFGVAL